MAYTGGGQTHILGVVRAEVDVWRVGDLGAGTSARAACDHRSNGSPACRACRRRRGRAHARYGRQAPHLHERLAEADGFEPPVPSGTLAFKGWVRGYVNVPTGRHVWLIVDLTSTERSWTWRNETRSETTLQRCARSYKIAVGGSDHGAYARDPVRYPPCTRREEGSSFEGFHLMERGAEPGRSLGAVPMASARCSARQTLVVRRRDCKRDTVERQGGQGP